MAFEDEPLQLEATAPAAHWNARVMVDGAGLFKAVWGLTKAHLAGDPKGVVDSALGASQIVKLADLT